jgi:NADH:ubiquinone oxidoreductase subunit H
MLHWLIGIVVLIIKLGLVLGCLLFLAAYLVWAERKLLARLQIRYGPNRAGKFGLLQPIADSIKMMTKEDIVPEAADRIIFIIAPAVVAVTALLMFAVVPFGNDGAKKFRWLYRISMSGSFMCLRSRLWGFTAWHWAAGPQIQNLPFWAESGGPRK